MFSESEKSQIVLTYKPIFVEFLAGIHKGPNDDVRLKQIRLKLEKLYDRDAILLVKVLGHLVQNLPKIHPIRQTIREFRERINSNPLIFLMEEDDKQQHQTSSVT
jgi:hypothetical protein